MNPTTTMWLLFLNPRPADSLHPVIQGGEIQVLEYLNGKNIPDERVISVYTYVTLAENRIYQAPPPGAKEGRFLWTPTDPRVLVGFQTLSGSQVSVTLHSREGVAAREAVSLLARQLEGLSNR